MNWFIGYTSGTEPLQNRSNLLHSRYESVEKPMRNRFTDGFISYTTGTKPLRNRCTDRLKLFHGSIDRLHNRYGIRTYRYETASCIGSSVTHLARDRYKTFTKPLRTQ